jgi:hypothetical protein
VSWWGVHASLRPVSSGKPPGGAGTGWPCGHTTPPPPPSKRPIGRGSRLPRPWPPGRVPRSSRRSVPVRRVWPTRLGSPSPPPPRSFAHPKRVLPQSACSTQHCVAAGSVPNWTLSCLARHTHAAFVRPRMRDATRSDVCPLACQQGLRGEVTRPHAERLDAAIPTAAGAR